MNRKISRSQMAGINPVKNTWALISLRAPRCLLMENLNLIIIMNIMNNNSNEYKYSYNNDDEKSNSNNNSLHQQAKEIVRLLILLFLVTKI